MWCLRELSTDSASSLGFTKLHRPFLLNVYVSGPQHYSSGAPSLAPVKSSATASTCFHWKNELHCTLSAQSTTASNWIGNRVEHSVDSLSALLSSGGHKHDWLKQTAAHPPLVSSLWFITCTFRHLKKNIKTFNQRKLRQADMFYINIQGVSDSQTSVAFWF